MVTENQRANRDHDATHARRSAHVDPGRRVPQVLDADAVHWRLAAQPVAQRMAAPGSQVVQEVVEGLGMGTVQLSYLLIGGAWR